MHKKVWGSGYVFVKVPDHPRARNGYMAEHVLIAEKALEKPIPPGVVVHHFNEDKSDNRNNNLVICPGNAYHRLLHKRTNALRGHRPKKLNNVIQGSSFPFLLKLSEAAQALQLSEETTRRKLVNGSIPGIKVGNLWRIKRDDLLALINSSSASA